MKKKIITITIITILLSISTLTAAEPIHLAEIESHVYENLLGLVKPIINTDENQNHTFPLIELDNRTFINESFRINTSIYQHKMFPEKPYLFRRILPVIVTVQRETQFLPIVKIKLLHANNHIFLMKNESANVVDIPLNYEVKEGVTQEKLTIIIRALGTKIDLSLDWFAVKTINMEVSYISL